jgi:hypothetical protein
MSITPPPTMPPPAAPASRNEQHNGLFQILFGIATLLLLGGISLYFLSSKGQASNGTAHRSDMANHPETDTPAPVNATTPDSSNRHTNDAQDSHAAENAAIKLEIDAQPESTTIPIVPLAELVDKVFGDYSNQDDRTNGQLDYTLVAVSGVVDLRGMKDAAPSDAKVYIKGKFAILRLRTSDAFNFSEAVEKNAAGVDVSNLPAEFNLYHTVDAHIQPDSIAAVQELHDGDPLIVVGEFGSASSGQIDLFEAHVPPPNEVQGNQVVVSHPISVRDMPKPWTW